MTIDDQDDPDGRVGAEDGADDPGRLGFVQDLVEDHRQRPGLGQAEHRGERRSAP